jgi:hypothetical protein
VVEFQNIQTGKLITTVEDMTYKDDALQMDSGGLGTCKE